MRVIPWVGRGGSWQDHIFLLWQLVAREPRSGDFLLRGPPCPSGLGWSLPGNEESTAGVVIVQDKRLRNAQGPLCLAQAENESPEGSF